MSTRLIPKGRFNSNNSDSRSGRKLDDGIDFSTNDDPRQDDTRDDDINDQDSATLKRNSVSGGNATAFGITDVGLRRKSNQDQFLIAQLNKSMLVSSTSLPMDTQSRLFGEVQGQLMLVADGMGGHAAGERASSLAVDHLVGRLLNSMHWFLQVDHDSEQAFVEALKELLQDAHARILRESSENLEQRGMGTTLTMAHVVWPRLYVVHVGDSRCYLVRDGIAEQLTTDHTLARRLVETGGLRPEEEATSRWSHVLWNVLGGRGEGELIAEVRRAELQAGDYLVLCSDGLHRYIEPPMLAEIIAQRDSPESVCTELVRVAIKGGGEDNITVIVAKPQPTSPAEAPLKKVKKQSDSSLEDTHPLDEASI